MKTETTNKVTPANVKAAVVAKKKILSNAAVIPLVCTKKKLVFLKVVKGNAEKSIEATKNAVTNKKIDSFEGAAKAFVKEHGIENLTVWNSRIAKVQPAKVNKSAEKQIHSWKVMGLTVVNAADFVAKVVEAVMEPAPSDPAGEVAQ